MSFATGSLVRARGREWVVLPGGEDDLVLVRPLGGTDDEETGILTALETIEPATFPLPNPEEVGDFRSGRLLRDALRLGFRSSAGPFRSFGRIAVTPRPYQLVPLLMALRLDPVRLLIADDVGVGKTIEALLIARELLDQGDVERMAVLCSPQLAEQWQREMREKFHIEAELVLPSTVRRLESKMGPRDSLFEVYPHTVVSTDFIKSERRRNDFLRTCPEFVIVDEAHTCVESTGGGRHRHQRQELLQRIADDAERHLLLVTATPHSGKEDAFRALLEVLNDDLAGLPDDLQGPQHEPDRRELAKYFVQRRRAHVRSYLEEDTPFPRRETAEEFYTLSEPYRKFFDKVLAFAREAVTEDGERHRQRVRWWSMLALLRSLASSPAAASATLRNRAATADTESPEEADEVGRRTVLDFTEDDAAEAVDVPPGADPGEEAEENRLRRRLLDYAREAEALYGPEQDQKLKRGMKIVKALVKDGFNPIVFCRFIPTAEYVAEHLREALPKKVEVAAVTGSLPPEEREARIAELGDAEGQRVLVCTDCLSEGVNLQEHFDAVVHYDLSWNPTRHEQREGRVDRYGQREPLVRTVTYYGSDNKIDGIVLEVLIRKHEAIRTSLGISVPVPIESDRVVQAITEGLLLRGQDPQQLQFDEIVAGERDALFKEWEDVAEREKRTRTMFAQEGLGADEVARELAAVRDALGYEADVERFSRDAVTALDGIVADDDGAVQIELREAPPAVRNALGGREEFVARFQLPVRDEEVYLSRTHPVVEHLAQHVLDTALDPVADGVAARCGAMRTKAIDTRTTLLLVRFRFNLVTIEDGLERSVVAEDARIFAFRGSPQGAEWLDPDEAEELLRLEPDANIGPDQATDFVGKVIDASEALEPHLNDEAKALADGLLDQHRRVRTAAQRKGVRFRVEPHLPPDVLGIYVLLPTA